MTRGAPIWEFGKYGATLFLLIAIARLPWVRSRTVATAIGMFLLLLPSIYLTLAYLDSPLRARRAISFYLSGPLCLAIAIIAFANARPRDFSPQKLLQWMSYPILATATVTLMSTARADDLVFIAESNFITSGHYGPNQVSGVLGLGAFLLFIGAINRPRTRTLFIFIAVWLLSQAVLTLSRGGVISAVAGAVAFSVHLLPNRRARWSLVTIVVLVFGLMNWVVLPSLNRFTEGSLGERYSEWGTSGRLEIALADLKLWAEHPILGVGPGISPRVRSVDRGVAAHTEFTRVLAEHGLLGALSILLLFSLCWSAYARAPGTMARAWVAGCAVWSLAGMAHSAMRIAATGLVCALEMLGTSYVTAGRLQRQEQAQNAAQ
jgi:hypothetical protein